MVKEIDAIVEFKDVKEVNAFLELYNAAIIQVATGEAITAILNLYMDG